MRKGHLSEYFAGVASKHLSAVEALPQTSHQHEFNGVAALKEMLGSSRRTFDAKFAYLCDDDPEPISDAGFLTWYDAREDHPTRSEYRLYFPTNRVSEAAGQGDLLVIGRRPDETLLVIITESESTIENQILWLFGLADVAYPGFSVKGEIESDQLKLEFASRYILEQLGVEIEETDENYLDQMLRRFGGTFPTTRLFSEYARSTLRLSPLEDPDALLLAWMEREEVLFRTFERHLIGDRLRDGFANDVDAFIGFSLSVQNRRKSRAGGALENHLECILSQRGIRYSRSAQTEGRAKPDFLFPGQLEYRSASFPADMLTMLGVKSSCKDRWRQVLAEADRIAEKHLLTLEPGISEHQTQEMKSKNLKLVLPGAIHATFAPTQQRWLLTILEFVELVRERQQD
jgi:EcoRII C terminal